MRVLSARKMPNFKALIRQGLQMTILMQITIESRNKRMQNVKDIVIRKKKFVIKQWEFAHKSWQLSESQSMNLLL